MEAMLRRYDPQTRFEQVCDLAAMKEIGDDGANPYKPDRAMINAVSDPAVAEAVMKGSGGAFRSHGLWYRFSFTCRASPDRMKVLSFTYQLGPQIPKAKWEEYGLFR